MADRKRAELRLRYCRMLLEIIAGVLTGIPVMPVPVKAANNIPGNTQRDIMPKIKLAMLLFSLVVSISGLCAQAFNPVNGTAYPVEFVEWALNGEDKLPVMQSLLQSSTIIFNSDNTVMTFGNALYTAVYTILSDGSCEVAIKALFIRRSVVGTGSIERSGRDFTLSISMSLGKEGENMFTVIKGNIK